MAQKITEALGGVERTGPSRIRFTIIQPGQGSSGFYSPEILERAANETVFPRGTLSMVDHPTLTESTDRPEGSLRDLAAVTLENAVWEPNWIDPKTGNKGRLAADARVGSAWAPFVDEFHEFIGASISAQAEVNESGDIMRLLPDPFNRVDLVTVAGAGGAVSEVIEAARVIESRSIIATETTERDVAMWLSSALRDELDRWCYVLDHDTQYVYYETYDDDNRGDRLYRRSYTLDGSTITLADDATQVHRRTEYDPVMSADDIDPVEPLDTPLPNPAGILEKEGATMATIDDAELKTLQEKAGRADELAAELEALKEAQAAQATEARQAQALSAVREAFGEEAPALYVTTAETAAQSEDYDHAAFTTMVNEAAGHQAQEAGTPNLGGGTATVTESKTITDDDIVNVLEGRA